MDSERELVAACARGEKAAWALLLRDHGRPVMRALYRLGARGELDDLRQEVWARLLARDGAALRRFRGERAGSLAVFLGRVARSVALDHLRRVKPEVEVPDALAHDGPDPEMAFGDAQQKNRLLAALESAAREAENPGRDRDILRLHFEDGHSPAEIAAMGIGLSARGVEAVLRRAKARIEELLKKP